jgi:hypothetical protein
VAEILMPEPLMPLEGITCQMRYYSSRKKQQQKQQQQRVK